MGEVIEMRPSPVMTKKQAADRYGVTERTIERWMAKGLPFSKPGGHTVRLFVVEADGWVRANELAG